MAGFNLSSALLIASVLLICGIATANGTVLFINNSTSFLSVGNFADKTIRLDPMVPGESSVSQTIGPLNSRDEFYIEQYVAVASIHGVSLTLEPVANVFVFDEATIIIFDPIDNQEGVLGVHVNYFATHKPFSLAALPPVQKVEPPPNLLTPYSPIAVHTRLKRSSTSSPFERTESHTPAIGVFAQQYSPAGDRIGYPERHCQNAILRAFYCRD